MDRGRATCGGQKPTAPTTRLIGYSLRINAYYATWLGMRSMREMTEMLGEDLRVDSGSGTGTRAELKVPPTGSSRSGQSTRIW
jgi:signal transduction histidine kinase